MKNSFKKLLIATGNKGKFFEIEALLKTLGIEAIPSFQFDLREPEETGANFAENSLIKAKFYGEKIGIPALADDSGLCVCAMKDAPGIHSARFAINENGKKDFPQAFKKIAEKIGKNRSAFFICNLSLFDPKTNFSISFEGRVGGELTFPPRGNQGFGYDPIFTKDGMDKTFGEISAVKKDQISHRAKAFKKFSKWLAKQNQVTTYH
ncbi:MAG: non-canonical purine NTP pyrophosphatase, RdgB/HAM1 family [Alphaproteobacteria bacterium RIFCSPLOWO2_01_FULL_40_26]|nr:MAG: non-canonical purine NTP pyrophosphatase, RdgB/HAM1 family [Alphaproteobacteria bacterium RIFCSPHIGHO2_02_FULL_40_34]OFW95368.1 MAG: non-canonical purine NTP pyrophosphatase, RdgB/HAM1 family [Alphaproteobacteria bacterium RIFCSPLOWO2_01_FULL_40_26]OFX09264.1 MAG: non-canonical purine NTP pyrophosphatase, RdgB/HAM1 family [Alphaproteobacteria bacterium RIFCSPLOWO2_02_FULL_40_19]OFX10802.1 MAG: non-canonical purine NTP pyrophosphatase, RdgB/HAM1 family [Alphaproteobacteria bacterium RIFCS